MPIRRGAFPYASFYLQGREDASEDFSVEDFDCAAIAKQIASCDEVYSTAMELAAEHIDLDDEKGEWIAENDVAGADPEKAYAAWRRGYVDEAACALETEVVNALVEIAEGDTAVETPSGKSRSSKRNPSSDGGSYAAWFQTGIADCENTFDATDLDDEIGDAVTAFQKHRQDISKLAAEAVKAWWDDDAQKPHWMGQHEADVRADRLKPDRAYAFWADGWRTQAQKYVAEKIVERAED